MKAKRGQVRGPRGCWEEGVPRQYEANLLASSFCNLTQQHMCGGGGGESERLVVRGVEEPGVRAVSGGKGGLKQCVARCWHIVFQS